MTAAEAARAALRERLMLAALAHIPFDGWTRRAAASGARALGLDEADAERLYPGGPAELFRAFNDWADARMAETVAAAAVPESRVSARVQAAILARFDALAPHREAVRRGIAFAALPGNAALGLGCLGRTLDLVWRLAGDRSADFSYYTKRALLGAVLAATTLAWLDDRTAGNTATREFLARRIADVLGIQRVRGAAARLAARLPSPFRRRAFDLRRR